MRALAAILVLTLGAGSARAEEPDYFDRNPNEGSTIRVRREKSRTLGQKLLIGGLLVGAAASLGAGAYYNLDSRDAANEVSSNDDLTGETWTAEHQATYDRAGTSGTKAIVGYALGGGFVAGAIIAAWLTQPGDEEVAVGARAARAVVAPVAGGALLGGAWSW